MWNLSHKLFAVCRMSSCLQLKIMDVLSLDLAYEIVAMYWNLIYIQIHPLCTERRTFNSFTLLKYTQRKNISDMNYTFQIT